MNTIKNRREDRGGAGAWDGMINLMRTRHLAVAVSKASPLKKKVALVLSPYFCCFSIMTNLTNKLGKNLHLIQGFFLAQDGLNQSIHSKSNVLPYEIEVQHVQYPLA